MNKDDLRRIYDIVVRNIESRPPWKREILSRSPQSTLLEPRKPIIFQKDQEMQEPNEREIVPEVEPTMKLTGKSYESVSEMVRDLSDEGFADNFKRYQAERRLINLLVVHRCFKGISQEVLAERMGCKKAKVVKMESSPDVKILTNDFISYAKALGCRIRFSIVEGLDDKDESCVVG